MREGDNGTRMFLAEFSVGMLESLSYQAMHDLMESVAKEIAGKVYEENKERIISGVDIHLLTGEIEKILVEKIKAESTVNVRPIED